jgi:GTP-binding protein HflX
MRLRQIGKPRPLSFDHLPRVGLIDSFESSMVEGELMIPYAKQAVVSQVYENARVVSETFDEAGRRMVVRALPGAMARLTRLISGT